MKTPIRCLLGFHQKYTDGALMYSVVRCNFCDWVEDERAAHLLDYERSLWKKYSGRTDEYRPELYRELTEYTVNSRKSVGKTK